MAHVKNKRSATRFLAAILMAAAMTLGASAAMADVTQYTDGNVTVTEFPDGTTIIDVLQPDGTYCSTVTHFEGAFGDEVYHECG